MTRSTRGVRRGVGVAALVMVVAGATAPFIPVSPSVSTAVADDTGATTNAFQVDPVHSAVIYRIKHMDVAYHYGRFNEFSGSFLFNADNPPESTVTFTIKTASVDSGNEGRDKHLRSPDFFNVEQFPDATFVSTSVHKTTDTTYEVTGNFTLNGTTKPITVAIHDTGRGKGRGGVEIAGIETTFEISRADFSLGGKGGVGDDVRITVSAEGGRK